MCIRDSPLAGSPSPVLFEGSADLACNDFNSQKGDSSLSQCGHLPQTAEDGTLSNASPANFDAIAKKGDEPNLISFNSTKGIGSVGSESAGCSVRIATASHASPDTGGCSVSIAIASHASP
eukprot:10995400-Karenia_brevis.AAC.1